MDCGAFKIYLKNGTTSITLNGNSWKGSDFSPGPVNLNINRVFSGACCAQADDNAVSLNGRIAEDNGRVYFTQVNHFSQSITTTARWNAIIIEFIAS